MICFVPGRKVEDKQEPGALSVEFDGTFHRMRADRFFDENDRPEKQLSGQQEIKAGELQVYFGKKAFESLLQALFEGEGYLPIMADSPLNMTVAKLDDIALGYENTFKDTSIIEITV